MPDELSPAVAAALTWRKRLSEDAGASARLRRAASVFDALMVEDTHRLLREVRRASERTSADLDRRLIVLAMTLPRLTREGSVSLVGALGSTAAGHTPSGEERARLSPARFGALARAAHLRDWDAFARALRRALAILGDTPVDVAGFARDLIGFGDATLRRWTYEYWRTLAPETETEDATP